MSNTDLDCRIIMLKQLEELETDETLAMTNRDLQVRIDSLKELAEAEA